MGLLIFDSSSTLNARDIFNSLEISIDQIEPFL